jgi:hypothetical protein
VNAPTPHWVSLPPSQCKIEALSQIIGRVSFESALYVGLKPHDNEGGILPIVADLATTDESVWCRCIGERKARSELGQSAPSTEKRRAVEQPADQLVSHLLDRLGCGCLGSGVRGRTEAFPAWRLVLADR